MDGEVQAEQRSLSVVTGKDSLGRIHSVETCGTVDGPGIRYVLFLSGCPIRCQYCHNPDAQGPPRGSQKTASDVIKNVLRYRNFIRSGGLTVSGGEPLLQTDFVRSVFVEAKQHDIHTALDTSGFLGHRADDALLAHTDLVLLDIKGSDSETYKRTTGVEIAPTLAFAKKLSKRKQAMWIRFVLVPGLSDQESNIRGVASFVRSLESVERIEILPFHKMGEHKYKSLGKKYQLADTNEPSREEVTRCQEIFAREGLTALI
ncbi:MAG: pyruvate formate-lyase-activating protein [Planctomycetota bacterium]